jgi:hypothetical protein
VNLYTHITQKQQKPSIYNTHTDWDAFRETLEQRIDTRIPLKSTSDIEKAIATLTNEIQQAARLATPPPRLQHPADTCPLHIKQKLTEKRIARRRWQITRAPEDKQKYNKCTEELKYLLHNHKNSSIQQYLENLTPPGCR